MDTGSTVMKLLDLAAGYQREKLGGSAALGSDEMRVEQSFLIDLLFLLGVQLAEQGGEAVDMRGWVLGEQRLYRGTFATDPRGGVDPLLWHQ